MGPEGCLPGVTKSGLTNRTQKVPYKWFLSRNRVRSVVRGVSKVMENGYKYQVFEKRLLRCRNSAFPEVAEAHLDMVFTAPTQLWHSVLESPKSSCKWRPKALILAAPGCRKPCP